MNMIVGPTLFNIFINEVFFFLLATLPMIIHYIQLSIILKKLKIFKEKTLSVDL